MTAWRHRTALGIGFALTSGIHFEPGKSTYDLTHLDAKRKAEFPLAVLMAVGNRDLCAATPVRGTKLELRRDCAAMISPKMHATRVISPSRLERCR
jgi:hypothetical protein